MRTSVRRGLLVAATTVVAFATSLVGGTAAQAAPDCPADHFCFYEHANFGGYRWPVPIASYYECGIVLPGDGWVSSVHNNTRFAIELWDVSASPDYLIGTAAPYRYYPSLGRDDSTDWSWSPGCP